MAALPLPPELASLEPLDLQLAMVLATAGEPLRRDTLAAIVLALGLRTGSKSLSEGMLAKPLRRLVVAKVALRANSWGNPYHCAPRFGHALLFHARERGDLPALASATAQVVGDHHYGMERARQLRHDLRLLVYLGRPKAALKQLVALEQDPYASYHGGPPSLAEVLGFDLPAEGLALLDGTPELAWRYRSDLLRYGTLQLAPIQQAAWQGCLTQPRPADVREQLLVAALLRGDRAPCEQIAAEPAEEDGDPTPRVAATFAALLAGDAAGARRAARSALEASRGPKKTRKPRLEGLCETFCGLLLVTSDDLEDRQLASAMLSLRRRRAGHVEIAGLLLSAFAELRDGIGDVPTSLRHYGGWTPLLVASLCAVYAGKAELLEAVESKLATLRQQAEAGGYRWIAAQLGALAALADRSAPSQDDPDVVLLHRLYQQRAAWQRTLEALGALAAQSGPPADARVSQRMLWEVSHTKAATAADFGWVDDERFETLLRQLGKTRERFDLSAKLQTLRGTTYTAGRRVSYTQLRRLAGEGRLSDEDVRVCAHFEPNTYGTISVGPRIWLALIGHPQVVWSSGEAAEVVRAQPTLVLREQGDGLRLSLRPEMALDAEGVCCERDGDRLLVYELTPAHQQVARLLHQPLELPAASRAQLEKTLAELSRVMPVVSDLALDGGSAASIDADARPVLRLRRRGSALGVQLAVAPLGSDGPTFAPGRGPLAVTGRRGGEPVVARRDLAREEQLVTALYQACPHLPIGAAQDEQPIEELLDCYELASELSTLSKDDVLVTWPEGQALSVVAQRDVRDVKLRVSRAANWFSASGRLELDEGESLDLGALLAALEARGRGRFIELDGGRLLALSARLRARLDELSALARRKRKTVELAPMALFLLEGWLAEGDGASVDRVVEAQLARLREARTLAPATPRTLRATLRDYQREGFVWLCRLAHWGGGACLADDMGLGKTVQVLALLLQRAEQGPAVVVAPTSVCGGWIEQARRFAPTLRLRRYGEGDRAALLGELGPYDVLVLSYGLLVQDIDTIAEVSFASAVLDEAQAIKNASTQRARAALRLRASCRVITTGTPVENHVGEIWSLMTFLNPGLLGSAQQFERRFAKPIVRDGDPEAARRLKQVLGPFVLRRRKAEVLDELPPKTEIVLPVALEGEHRALYELLRRRAQARIEQAGRGKGTGKPQERMQLLAELMKLRRAACHPKLVVEDSELPSAKLTALLELLEELREGGHQALVFSQFVDHLTLVRAQLDALGVGYQYLDGSTAAKQRERAVAAFQRGQSDLFLISLRAGGFGLNLTAADYVVHLDPWWNPAVEDQASDRAHRIGQTRPVTIYKLVSEGTIEERILALHGEKRALAEQLLADTGGSALSVEQLRELLASV